MRLTRETAPDLIARAAVALLFLLLSVTLLEDFARTRHLTGLLLLVSEAMVVVFTIFRRRADIVDRSAEAMVVTTISLLGPPLLRPSDGLALLPDAMTAVISAVGLCVVIAGKFSLGRSFGLAPANRGVVSTGLYRLVRHPIYLGYLITHVGFVIANPISWNFAILAVADVALLLRAIREERTLAGDAAYRKYMQCVRWRIVPGLF